MKKPFFINWSKKQKIFFLIGVFGVIGLVILITWPFNKNNGNSNNSNAIPPSSPSQAFIETAKIVEQFIPIYTTYDAKDKNKMLEQIRPFTTDELYAGLKTYSANSDPSEEFLGSRFIKLEKCKIRSVDKKMFWDCLVTIEKIKTNGKKVEMSNYEISLVKEKDKWKISKVLDICEGCLIPARKVIYP